MIRLTTGNPNTPEAFDRLWANVTAASRHRWNVERFRLLLGGVDDQMIVGDLGCGCSAFLSYAMNHRRRLMTHGLDFSPWAIEYMQAFDPRVTWRCGDVRATRYPDDFFDVVIATDLLEHVDDPAALLVEMRRIVRPGGHLKVSVGCEGGDRFRVWRIGPGDLVGMLQQLGLRTRTTVLGHEEISIATR